MTIRFATAADTEILSKNAHVSKEILARKIELGEFVVAADESELLGFLQIEYLWSLVPYIALIRVFPDHQRKGVGKALLAFVEKFLSEKEHRRLYSSSQANEPEPQAWHRHMGFVECGVIKEINDGIDEIFFFKKLGEK